MSGLVRITNSLCNWVHNDRKHPVANGGRAGGRNFVLSAVLVNERRAPNRTRVLAENARKDPPEDRYGARRLSAR
jgi:hypothetical protein